MQAMIITVIFNLIFQIQVLSSASTFVAFNTFKNEWNYNIPELWNYLSLQHWKRCSISL